MQAGRSWQEAATEASVQISRSTAYRWFQQFLTRGEAALHDGRHGHIAKVHKPIQEWLEARCRQEPRRTDWMLRQNLGCRALVLLHDEQGHPRLVTTHRGDQHLTMGLPPFWLAIKTAKGKHHLSA